jgi:hypothetical protein
MVSRIIGSGSTSNVPEYPVKDGFYFQTEQATNPKFWRPRSFSFVYLQNCKKFGNQGLEVKCEFNFFFFFFFFFFFIIIIIIINIKDWTL